jgi:hypothetical protein
MVSEKLVTRALTATSEWARDTEYVFYHPGAEELFLLPLKPELGTEDKTQDITVEGTIILEGVFYIGEL